MPKRTSTCLFRRLLVQTLALVFAVSAFVGLHLEARAQASPGDATAAVGISAALAGRADALRRAAAAKATSAPASTDTPPPAVTDSDQKGGGFEGNRFTYSVDVSSMIAGGKTDNDFSDLPGGMDAELIYKVSRNTRLVANYYQFSATPLGNDDEIPVVFQGTSTPIGYVNGNSARIDPTTHLRFQFYSAQQMFYVGGRHHPLILAPAYLDIRSSIGGKDDTGTIFANNTIMPNVHQRSYQNEGLNLAIPLFYGEKYLIAYTGGGLRNQNMNGANLTNHIQYLQSAYAQYQPSQDLTLFVNYVGAITYFPTDSYPYHVPTFHYGISKNLTKGFFVEGEVSTGGPSNPNYGNTPGRIGIPDLVVPCAATAAGKGPNLPCVALAGNGVAVPFVGAQRFTTFSIIFGYGANPLVRPF